MRLDAGAKLSTLLCDHEVVASIQRISTAPLAAVLFACRRNAVVHRCGDSRYTLGLGREVRQ